MLVARGALQDRAKIRDSKEDSDRHYRDIDSEVINARYTDVVNELLKKFRRETRAVRQTSAVAYLSSVRATRHERTH